jgi:hypothetical protein
MWMLRVGMGKADRDEGHKQAMIAAMISGDAPARRSAHLPSLTACGSPRTPQPSSSWAPCSCTRPFTPERYRYAGGRPPALTRSATACAQFADHPLHFGDAYMAIVVAAQLILFSVVLIFFAYSRQNLI